MKLPVFTAFGASISYIAAHFLTLLRITWLPALLMMAVMAYVMPTMLEAQLNLAASDGDEAVLVTLGQSVKSSGYVYLASAILYPMLVAGVLRHVMRGDGPRFLPFYLWFGADEFRVLVCYIIWVVMLSVASFAGMLGVIVAGLASSLAAPAVGGIVIALLTAVFFIALLWFALRMSLIFPATVAEREIGIGRSWQVTKGAVWSLFLYWILWGVLLAFIAGVYAVFGAGNMLAMLPEVIAAGTDEAMMKELEQRMLEMQMELYDMSKPGFWTYSIATYLYMIISISFSSVAGGVAYRYFSGQERGRRA